MSQQTQLIERKISEIEKRINMLSDVINYGYGFESCVIHPSNPGCSGGQKLSPKSKEIRQKYTAQLKAYKTKYGTASPIYHYRMPSLMYANLYDASNIGYNNYTSDSSGKQNLQKELDHLIQELTNQESFLQNQLIEQANSKTAQEEEKIRLLQEELAANKHKTEQERQKAEQELQKAKLEAEKARLAADLAKQGGAGNIAAGKTLLGTWESRVGTSPWIIAGISVGALTVGAIVFRILR